MRQRKTQRHRSGKPVVRLCGNVKIFGLSDAQITEWYRRLSDPRPRQRIYLEGAR